MKRTSPFLTILRSHTVTCKDHSTSLPEPSIHHGYQARLSDRHRHT